MNVFTVDPAYYKDYDIQALLEEEKEND